MWWLLMAVFVLPSQAADPDREATRLDRRAWKQFHDDPAACVVLADHAMAVSSSDDTVRTRISETRALCDARARDVVGQEAVDAVPRRARTALMLELIDRLVARGELDLADATYRRLGSEARRSQRARVHVQGVRLALLREDERLLHTRLVAVMASDPSVDEKLEALDALYALEVSVGNHASALDIALEQLALAPDSSRPVDETLARSISVLQSAFEAGDEARVEASESSIRTQLDAHPGSWLSAMARRALGELASARGEHATAVVELTAAVEGELPPLWRRETYASLARNLEALGRVAEARRASMQGWRLDREARAALRSPALRRFDREHHHAVLETAYQDHLRLWAGRRWAPRAWHATLEHRQVASSPREICRALGPMEVLVDAVRTGDGYAVFVVDRFCQPSRIDLADAETIDGWLNDGDASDSLWYPLLNALCWRRAVLVVREGTWAAEPLKTVPHPDGGVVADHHDLTALDHVGAITHRRSARLP